MEKLLLVLEQTLNPDARVRRDAESYLGESSGSAGFLVLLLQVVVMPNIPPHVQLSAAVQLKNAIQLNWDTTKSQMKEYARREKKLRNDQYIGNLRKFLIAEEDKVMIRNNMVQAMAIAQQSNLRKTLGACVRYISITDFPEKWPNVVEQSLGLIRNQDPSQMHAGLLIIDKIFKKYAYMSRDQKNKKRVKEIETMFALVGASFPLIRSLGEALIPVQESYAPELLRLCAKIFFKGFRRIVPPYMNNSQELEAWSKLVVSIAERPVPHPSQEDSWWSAKRRAFQIMDHFLRNNARVLSGERTPEFVNMVAGEHGIIKQLFLPCVLKTLHDAYVGNQVCTNVVKMLCFSIIENAVDHATLFQVLKGHLPFLVEHVFVTAVSWTTESLEEWEADPEQFIHGVYSFGRFEEVKGMSLQDDAAQAFESMCRFRQRYVMPTVMQILDSVVREYQSNPMDQRNALRKSGVLRLIQELAFLFKKDRSFHIEPMIVSHVLPDTQSPLKFIRFAACRALSEYFDIKWSSPEQEVLVAQAAIQLLVDKEVPVSVEAAVCLARLFKYATPAMDGVVIQVIPQLIESFHSLSQRVGIDTVFGSMQTLIEKYPSHVRPYGIQICTSLANAFYKITMVDERDDEDEELDTAAAAGDCLNSLETMLASFVNDNGEISDENKQLLLGTVPPMVPLFSLVLVGGTINEHDAGTPAYAAAMELYNGQLPVSKNVDLLDNCEVVLNMMHRVVYHARVVPAIFWKYVPLLANIVAKTEDEYILEIFSVIETMVHFDPEGFLQPCVNGTDHFAFILGMVRPTVEATVRKACEAPGIEDEEDDEDFDDEADNDNDFYMDDGAERGAQAAAHGALIFSTMFQACVGQSKIDTYVKAVLDVVVPAVDAPINDPWVLTNFLNVIESAIYHNMPLTLSVIGQQGLYRVIELCQEYLESHNVLCEKLILLLAFVKLVTIPSSQVEPRFKQVKRDLIISISRLFTDVNQLRAEAEKRIQESKAKQNNSSSVSQHPEEEDDRSLFRRQGPTDCPEDMNTFDYVDDSYVEPSWDELDDPDGDEDDVDHEYESPVDSLDEFVYFYKTFSQAGGESQQEFQDIMAALPSDVCAIMQQVIEEGGRRATAGVTVN